MAERDSLNKVISVYFAAVTAEVFTYAGIVYEPRPIMVSPLILRGFTCPSTCGGCCPRFSLDYLPTEERPASLTKRWVTFGGREVLVYSDLQNDGSAHFCKHLNLETGRCMEYRLRPFSCDFELIRFIQRRRYITIASQQLFGRGWAMKRVDAGRGARCSMAPVSDESLAETIRKFRRLATWADHFQITTKVPDVINWCKSGPHAAPLRLS